MSVTLREAYLLLVCLSRLEYTGWPSKMGLLCLRYRDLKRRESQCARFLVHFHCFNSHASVQLDGINYSTQLAPSRPYDYANIVPPVFSRPPCIVNIK